jgi:hypothetical protein
MVRVFCRVSIVHAVIFTYKQSELSLGPIRSGF